MFPGVDGFRWTLGHILFLSLFFAVALTILVTVVSAVWRTVRDFRTNRAIELCWKSDFAELPETERRCRHELAGRVMSRICDNAFDCRHCSNYSQFAVQPARGIVHDLGINYSKDRFYHRGHTWVKPEEDGTLTIGPDELAERLIGSPDSITMPDMGTEIETNGTAWQMKKNGKEIRVRAPIEGTVIGYRRPEGRLVSEDTSAAESKRSGNAASSSPWTRSSLLAVTGTGAVATATPGAEHCAQPGGRRSAGSWRDGRHARSRLGHGARGNVSGNLGGVCGSILNVYSGGINPCLMGTPPPPYPGLLESKT